MKPDATDSVSGLAGVILAGGSSRRMGGANKALLPLAGLPLIRRVIERLGPQVGVLYLSVAQASVSMAALGLPLVTDPQPATGPLAGLLGAMREAGPEHQWVLLAPCDAPFIPRDLAVRLLERATSTSLPGAIVSYQSENQPTFSLWNCQLLPRLEQAVMNEKMAGFKQFLRVVELAILDWPESEPSPFFNINDQAALSRASSLVEAGTGVQNPCSA